MEIKECAKCGACCRVVALQNVSPEKIEANMGNSADWAFLALYWTNISQEEALKINPYLQEWINDHPEVKYYFYTCEQYDELNKLCLVHGKGQPRVCSGYPYYGNKKPEGNMGYSKNCIFYKEEESDGSISNQV